MFNKTEYKKFILRVCRHCGRSQQAIINKKPYVEHCYGCGREFYVPSMKELEKGGIHDESD